MKLFFALLIAAFSILPVFAQNEQSPIVKKDISYKDWKYSSVRDDAEIDLRELSRGKKLVIVVYFAPWCGNWKHDVPFLERFYEQYKSSGLEIVGVGEYDPVDKMKANLDAFKVTFPVVYESVSRTDKEHTKHHDYRRSTGDTRNWGSPWYVLLDPAEFTKKGDTLVSATNVINGEMIEAEGEKFIREKLGLPPENAKASTAANAKVEACDPGKKPELKKAD